MNKVRLLGVFLAITGVLLMGYTEHDLLGFMEGALLGGGSIVVFSGRRTFQKRALSSH